MYANYHIMKALTSIILDTRKALKTGKYPVKLRVTFNRTQKYYPADLYLTKSDFETVIGKNPKGEHKRHKLSMDALEQKANHIIENLPVFDFDQFKRSLYSNQMVRNDVYSYYDKMIKTYKSNGNLGTASNYNCSMASLKKFKPSLTFIEVTVDFLEKYEKSLLNGGRTVTTVSMYVRSLRSVINHAVADGTLSKEYNYPFGSKSKYKYQIPTSRNIKKALTIEEIKLLFDYKPVQGSWEAKAKDFWIFSYLANGMNMKDIANLRYRDIDGDYIKFVRAKTANTTKVISAVSVYLTKELKTIIQNWGRIDIVPENLIFQIIDPKSSLEKQRSDCQQFIKMVNKYMKGIAETLEIKKPCTTYYARHSFSTVLKRSGANIQFISEALGHSSISTTKSYLDSFEDETKKEMAKALTNFG
jgi:integrase